MAEALSNNRCRSLPPGTSSSEPEARWRPFVASQNRKSSPCRPGNAIADTRRGLSQTRGEIEAAVCKFISCFEQDFIGRGPKSIRANLIDELLVVRLQGVLTAAEQQLVKSDQAEKGRDLLKQVRTHLMEAARPMMESMVNLTTGARMLSLHYDISTVTDEEVLLFTLAEAPRCREPKNGKIKT